MSVQRCECCGTRSVLPGKSVKPFKTLPHHVVASSREGALRTSELAMLCTGKPNKPKGCYTLLMDNSASHLARAVAQHKYESNHPIRLVRYVCTAFNQRPRQIFDTSAYYACKSDTTGHSSKSGKHAKDPVDVDDFSEDEADKDEQEDSDGEDNVKKRGAKPASAKKSAKATKAAKSASAKASSSSKVSASQASASDDRKMTLSQSPSKLLSKSSSAKPTSASASYNASSAKKDVNTISIKPYKTATTAVEPTSAAPQAKDTSGPHPPKMTRQEASAAGARRYWANKRAAAALALEEAARAKAAAAAAKSRNTLDLDDEDDMKKPRAMRGTKVPRAVITRPATVSRRRALSADKDDEYEPQDEENESAMDVDDDASAEEEGEVDEEEAHSSPPTSASPAPSESSHSSPSSEASEKASSPQRDSSDVDMIIEYVPRLYSPKASAKKTQAALPNAVSDEAEDTGSWSSKSVAAKKAYARRHYLAMKAVKAVSAVHPVLLDVLEKFKVQKRDFRFAKPPVTAAKEPIPGPFRPLIAEHYHKVQKFAFEGLPLFMEAMAANLDVTVPALQKVLESTPKPSSTATAPVASPAMSPIHVHSNGKASTPNARLTAKLKERAAMDLRLSMDRPTRSQLASHPDTPSSTSNSNTTSSSTSPHPKTTPKKSDVDEKYERRLKALKDLGIAPSSINKLDKRGKLYKDLVKSGLITRPGAPLVSAAAASAAIASVTAALRRGELPDADEEDEEEAPPRVIKKRTPLPDPSNILPAHQKRKATTDPEEIDGAVPRVKKAAKPSQAVSHPPSFVSPAASYQPVNLRGDLPPTKKTASSSFFGASRPIVTSPTATNAVNAGLLPGSPSASSTSSLSLVPHRPTSYSTSTPSTSIMAAPVSRNLSNMSAPSSIFHSPQASTASPTASYLSPSRSQMISVPISVSAPANSPFLEILKDARSKVPIGSRANSMAPSPASTPTMTPATSSSSLAPLLGSNSVISQQKMLTLGRQSMLSGMGTMTPLGANNNTLAAAPMASISPIALLFPTTFTQPGMTMTPSRSESSLHTFYTHQ